LLLVFPALADRRDLDMESQQKTDEDATGNRTHVSAEASQSIDWYAEGEERIVEAGGVRIAVRFVGRKGRRGRIAITAPPGAAFLACDRNKTVQSPDCLV
jgi:hypothetical protein